jgi:hypothetical protein
MTPLIKPEYHTIFSSPLLSMKGFLTILNDKGSKMMLINLMKGIRQIMMIAILRALH